MQLLIVGDHPLDGADDTGIIGLIGEAAEIGCHFGGLGGRGRRRHERNYG
jgi:hypothetical protein